MNHFYEATINVLVHADALIDKLVGDEVIALFIPGSAGKERAHKAVIAGRALLKTMGYEEPGGPWIPIGVGIHTGEAWVGSIVGASGTGADYTALGDNVNIAARLAYQSGPGEILTSEATCDAAQIVTDGLVKRSLEMKRKGDLVPMRVLYTS